MTYAEYCRPITDAIATLAKTADKWDVPPEWPDRTWWSEWVAVCDGGTLDSHPDGEDWLVDVFGWMSENDRLLARRRGWRSWERRARYNADPDDNQWLVDVVAEMVANADPAATKAAAEHIRMEKCAMTWAARRRLPARGGSGNIGHNAGY